MPIVVVKVSGSAKISREAVSGIKGRGHLLGYKEPAKIHVELNDGLTEDDVLLLFVTTDEKNWRREPGFTDFCAEVSAYLALTTGKSVEVFESGYMRPIASSMKE